MGNTRSASVSSAAASRCSHKTSHKSSKDALLNPYQKATVQDVFRHMSMSKTGHGNCGRTVVKRLLHKDSDIKCIFENTNAFSGMIVAMSTGSNSGRCGVDEHSNEIVKLLQFVIDNLDSPHRIAEECERIGRIHRRLKMFGMKTEHWDLVGEAISETVREYQGWRKHREALRSANILVSMIVDRFRKGYQQKEGDKRRGRYTPSARSLSEIGSRESRDSMQLESSVASMTSEMSSKIMWLDADEHLNAKRKGVNRSRSLNTTRRVLPRTPGQQTPSSASYVVSSLPKTPESLDSNANLLLSVNDRPVRKYSEPPRMRYQIN
ncbi:hypothetical protein L596_007994 [Steinernema carpocapsae]|uniref:Globin domain-containing protein n=1 Tax=Steinernema carpocapsae TaxID=34508 RepID=A0A4U5PB39_STECR|nr:hypothetical protein L596_007994 [Steinernema carpocapsae]